MENKENFYENIRNSFKKIKEDVQNLQDQINVLKKEISDDKMTLTELLNKINNIYEKANIQTNNDTNINNSLPNRDSSIGNYGVLHARPPSVRLPSAERPPSVRRASAYNPTPQATKTLKLEIEQRFRSLTDMEFKVYCTIYQMEEEISRAITYEELARKLKLSVRSIKDHIKAIITKEIPLIKTKSSNFRMYFSIPEDIRNLNLLSKIMKFREFDGSQRTIF